MMKSRQTTSRAFLIHLVGHLVMNGRSGWSAGPALPKPVLAGSYPLVVLYVPCDHIQHDLFHNPSGHAPFPGVAFVYDRHILQTRHS